MARKPVVFVPGFPASQLVDAATGEVLFPPKPAVLFSKEKKKELLRRLRGPDDPDVSDGIDAGRPIRHSARIFGVDVHRQADSLYDALERIGYDVDEQGQSADFRPVGWDWRLPVDHPRTQSRLRAAITDLHAQSGARVVVIVHSTGGLVFRSLLEKEPELVSKIDRLVSIGVPWAGTLKAVRCVAEGIGLEPGLITDEQARVMFGHAHAAYDLMPPDPARTDMTDADGALLLARKGTTDEATSPLVSHGWLGGNASWIARAKKADLRLGGRTPAFDLPAGVRLPVTNIAGWGVPTDVSCRVMPSAITLANGKKKSSALHGSNGDGTVPRRSAGWLRGPDVRTFHVPGGIFDAKMGGEHSQLWASKPVRQLLERVLLGNEGAPFLHAALDRSDVNAKEKTVKIRVVAQAADATPLPGAYVQFDLGSKQPSTKWQIRSGWTEIEWRRPPGVQGAAILCPITVYWNDGSARSWDADFLIPA